MMATWTAAARQVTRSARLYTPQSAATSSQAPKLIHRRGFSGAADAHGPPKVNLWEDPMNPSRWKEEHFVIASLSGWGLIFFLGYKKITGGKKDNKEEKKADGTSK